MGSPTARAEQLERFRLKKFTLIISLDRNRFEFFGFKGYKVMADFIAEVCGTEEQMMKTFNRLVTAFKSDTGVDGKVEGGETIRK